MSTAPASDTSRLGDAARVRLALAAGITGALAWVALVGGWLRWLGRTVVAVRHHRWMFVAVAVVDGMVLAAIGNTYFYYKQPELVAAVGPMWNPDVQKYLFVMQVVAYAALLVGLRGVRALLRRRG